MNYRYIFVLASGRSGSTLVQGILNSIDEVKISGENNGVHRRLIESYSLLKRAIHRHAGFSHEVETPWYTIGKANLEDFGRELRLAFEKNILQPEPHHKTIGFKEIRYNFPTRADLEHHLDTIREIYPSAGFVLNTRNINDIILSNARAKHAAAERHLRQLNQWLGEIAGERDDCCLVHYDDYVANPARLKTLFDFVGAEFDLARVNAVLARPHSSVTSK